MTTVLEKGKDRKQLKDKEMNIYCIVLSSTVPRFTRKGDWMVQVTITDESISSCTGNPDLNTGDSIQEEEQFIPSVTLTVFNKDKNVLPKALCAGEILRLHRVIPDVSSLLQI